MGKTKNILKRTFAIVAAAFMGMSAVCVTAPTPVYAAPSVDDLYNTMDEALRGLQNAGFDYYSAGTCTGTLARVLMHVDEVYGTDFGQIEYFIGAGPSNYLQPGGFIAKWSASQVINGAREYGADEIFVSNGINNIDGQLDASDARSGDLFVMENYPTGIEAGASGHCGFIQRIGNEVYVRQLDTYYGIDPVRASTFVNIQKGGQIHIFRIGATDKPVTITITKSSDCTNVTEDNSMYSLAGAEYGVYLDSACSDKRASMTTDGDGNASSGEFRVPQNTATVYVKETKASPGYKLDPTVYTINIGVDGTTGHIDVKETPVDDPIGIVLTKKTEDGLIEPASLEGAEFTVKYYDRNGDSLADFDNLAPTRTWVIQTLRTDAGFYTARLDDEHKVGGDEFYYDDTGSFTVLPLGAIIIQETKAPVGYLLEGATINDLPVAETDGGSILLNVRQDGNEAYIDGGQYLVGSNYYDEIEVPIHGGIEFQKVDSVTKLPVPQGDASFANTKFAITNNNDYQILVRPNGNDDGAVTLNPGESYTITTDENGHFLSPKNFLTYGKYTMTETGAPKGYTPYTDYAADDSQRTVMSVSFEIPEDTTLNERIWDLSSLGVETSDVVNDMAKMGDFTIEKYDFEMGTDTQGDAPNLVAEFELYNRSAKTVRVLGKDYAPNTVIMTVNTNEVGVYESKKDILPYGTYEIIETGAPIGYTVAGKLDQTFEIRDDHEHEDLTTFVPENPERSNSLMNKVVVGDFEIYKTRGKNNDSSISFAEEGVEFAAIHKEFVDTFCEQAEADLEAEGKFDQNPITDSQRDMMIERRAFLMAYQAIADATGNGAKTGYNTKENWTGDLEAVLDLEDDGLTKKEWSLFRTGKDGRGRSRDLAYGDYVVGQTRKSNVNDTEETDEREVLEDVWVFSVTTQHTDQETKYYTVVNNPQQYFLRLIKKDADTGKDVVLNSADFQVTKIKDVDGNIINLPVTQNVGFSQYNTYETNAKNTAKRLIDIHTYLSPTDEDATVALPDEIEAGDYEVTEIITPWGFVAVDPIPFHLNEKIAETDDRGEFITVLEIDNQRVWGQIDLQKSIEEWEDADKDLVSHNFTEIGFTLKADENIVNPDDGELLYSKGDVVKLLEDGSGKYHAPVTDEEYERAAVGEPRLDKDGHLFIDNLPLGTYTLQETKTLDGLVVTDTVYTITYTQDDKLHVEGNRDELVTVRDNKGETLFEKAVSGEKNIAAKLNVVNEETHWTISKTDVTGQKELPGAKLTVTEKATGEVVDEWTSTTEKHNISGLKVDTDYILTEIASPEDEYAIAVPIEFHVENDAKVREVHMVDKLVTMSKVDVGGEEVPGAEMTVTDKETGEEVDSWTSDKTEHKIKHLVVGRTYILHEDTTPAGFVKATDMEFTVLDDGIDQHEEMIDKIVTITKTDATDSEELPGAELRVTDKETGEEIDKWTSGDAPHQISGLEEGRTYILYEDLAPIGYAKASAIEFFVEGADEDGLKTDQVVHMIDKIVDLSKVEIGGGEELPGAEIVITDKETGEKVDEWTSGNEPHRIENLEVGKTYIFHEEGAPDGHYYAADSEFIVKDDGKDTHLEIIDAPIEYEIYKINDKDGSIVPGVTLELYDLDAEEPDEGKEGAMVEGFPVITTDKPIELGSQLIPEHTYKLIESEWVKGVHKAVSLEFTVSKYAPDPDEEGIIQPVVITMVDEYNSLAFQKVDDTGKPLAGAEFQILEATYDENGKAIPKLDDEGKQIVVAEFVSNDKPEGVAVDKNGVELASLLKGDDRDDETTGEDTDAVYLLHESKTPFGYEGMAEDMPFTVTGTEEFPQVIRVTNKRNHFFVSAVKVDASDKTKMLKGAEITIFNAKTNEIAKTADGKDAKGITDGRGVYMFELVYSEDGYYAKETAAPTGYLLNSDKHEVKLSEDYNFAKDNPIVIVVADTPQSKTAAGAPVVAGGIGIAAMAALAVLYVTRRKEDDAEANANA